MGEALRGFGEAFWNLWGGLGEALGVSRELMGNFLGVTLAHLGSILDPAWSILDPLGATLASGEASGKFWQALGRLGGVSAARKQF